MTRYDDDQYVQEQFEINRRLEIEAEQEPAWMHRKRRNRYLGRNGPGPERRYFSRLMFRPLPPISPPDDVAEADAMSYIPMHANAQGRVDDDSHPDAAEGSVAEGRGRGAAQLQSDGGAGAGAVPGVAA